MMDLKLSKDTVLVGFYTKPTQLPSNRRVSPQVKVWAVVPQRAELNPHGARPGGGTFRGIARADFGSQRQPSADGWRVRSSLPLALCSHSPTTSSTHCQTNRSASSLGSPPS